MNTPGFEPGTQWSEVECSTARPSAPRSVSVCLFVLVDQQRVLNALVYPQNAAADVYLADLSTSHRQSQERYQ